MMARSAAARGLLRHILPRQPPRSSWAAPIAPRFAWARWSVQSLRAVNWNPSQSAAALLREAGV